LVLFRRGQCGTQRRKVAFYVFRYLHSKAENTGAIELLQEAMKHHAAVFEDEDANMLCELMILSKRYGDVLQVSLSPLSVAV